MTAFGFVVLLVVFSFFDFTFNFDFGAVVANFFAGSFIENSRFLLFVLVDPVWLACCLLLVLVLVKQFLSSKIVRSQKWVSKKGQKCVLVSKVRAKPKSVKVIFATVKYYVVRENKRFQTSA